jgi:hypothetical protein
MVDTPESYPHDLGISYPPNRHKDFEHFKVILIDLSFVHRFRSFIPIPSTCSWAVDNLSTDVEEAFQAQSEHMRRGDGVPKQGLIHISTWPTATAIFFYFMMKKES